MIPAPNKTLKGHKLLIINPEPLPEGYVCHLQNMFPDLVINFHIVSWLAPVPADCWDGVTIVMSAIGLPSAEQAPNLQLVQLVSAGADFVLKLPFYKGREITMCTANGLHGYVLDDGRESVRC